jgi:cystathionine beta-lyase/cystathionine gamma-synthase
MQDQKMHAFLKLVVEHMPSDWLRLTTHRLDIYHEDRAKSEFLDGFEALYKADKADEASLEALPTAFDYIRLGHPLSCVLEWAIAKQHQLKADQVISFSSRIMPILAILRKNLLSNKPTQIAYAGELPSQFDPDTIRKVYGYRFELVKVNSIEDIPPFEGSTIYLSRQEDLFNISLSPTIDFYIGLHSRLGSLILANGDKNKSYVGEIQHVRRRESIAMTPANCMAALQMLIEEKPEIKIKDLPQKKASVLNSINEITGADTKAVIGSSGLSIQYAIMMGLIEEALNQHPGKEIKIIIPPNCYGGTNDQARRVAACLRNVEIVDLPVDRDHNMVDSIDQVLDQLAIENAVPYIIVEIPTNPRVEVPDLDQLRAVLSRKRKAANGKAAIDPVFILDQTFCPNVHFLGEEDILSEIRTISYVSGSKFPSGGLCTAGYCLTNKKAAGLMANIDKHLKLCDNEATDLQIEILSKQLPSMVQRIKDAYKNTREFVNFIQEHLPTAKINFVSEELAHSGFTPSVFSLDLPTKGETHHEREEYKRALNLKLINMMISQIPGSKYCVSYGQLKGCYWTIPATSTQGTTKEEDKDYIARVSCSQDMDLEKHKEVFLDFVSGIKTEV